MKQTSTMRRKLRGRLGLALILIVAVVIFGYYEFVFGANRGPSFIDKLQSGALVITNINSVEILHFDAGNGWPFREQDYKRMDRAAVSDPKDVEVLMKTLGAGSDPRIKSRNHPETLRYGIVRIEMRTGEHYYVIFTIEQDQNGEFADLGANSADSTNPNNAKHYENTEIVPLLKRVDPWFGKSVD